MCIRDSSCPKVSVFRLSQNAQIAKTQHAAEQRLSSRAKKPSLVFASSSYSPGAALVCLRRSTCICKGWQGPPCHHVNTPTSLLLERAKREKPVQPPASVLQPSARPSLGEGRRILCCSLDSRASPTEAQLSARGARHRARHFRAEPEACKCLLQMQSREGRCCRPWRQPAGGHPVRRFGGGSCTYIDPVRHVCSPKQWRRLQSMHCSPPTHASDSAEAVHPFQCF